MRENSGDDAPLPLLVTGLPRSATSWAGKMLEASGSVVYLNEPLNPRHPPGRTPGVLDVEVTHQFQYICPDNEHLFLPGFRDAVAFRFHPVREVRRNHSVYDLGRAVKYWRDFSRGRRGGMRAMFDDPYAVLSCAWFAQRLDASILVMIREPAAFVGSWRNLGWTIHYEELLGQPLLLRDLLGPWEAEMRALVGSSDDIAKSSLLWRMTYSVIAEQRKQISTLHVRRHEDLSRDPIGGFQELYAELGLPWSTDAEAEIRAATTGGTKESAHRWTRTRGGLSNTAFRPQDSAAALGSYRQRLTEAEVERVRELTADVSTLYYEPAS